MRKAIWLHLLTQALLARISASDTLEVPRRPDFDAACENRDWNYDHADMISNMRCDDLATWEMWCVPRYKTSRNPERLERNIKCGDNEFCVTVLGTKEEYPHVIDPFSDAFLLANRTEVRCIRTRAFEEEKQGKNESGTFASIREMPKGSRMVYGKIHVHGDTEDTTYEMQFNGAKVRPGSLFYEPWGKKTVWMPNYADEHYYEISRAVKEDEAWNLEAVVSFDLKHSAEVVNSASFGWA